MPFKLSATSDLCFEIQTSDSSREPAKSLSDLNLPELSLKDFAYPYSYEELPSISSSSKFIFPIVCFGKNPEQDQFEEKYTILKMPYYDCAYLMKKWCLIESQKMNTSLSDYRLKADPYQLSITSSNAPYGYEFEDMFQQSVQYVPYSDRDTTLTASFMSFIIKNQSEYEDEKLISHTAFKVGCSYEKKTNTLYTRLIKKSRIQFKFWKESKSLVKVLGKGNLTFNDGPLPDFIKIRMEEYAKANCPNILPILAKKPYSFYSIYRKIFKNPLWSDLNSPFAAYYLKSGSNHYNRIVYHYKRYGTKAARQALFRTKNKALIREYSKLDYQDLEVSMRATQILKNSFNYTEEKCTDLLKQSIALSTTVRNRGAFGSVGQSFIYSDRMFTAISNINSTYSEITIAKIYTLLKEQRYSFSETVRELMDIDRSISLLLAYQKQFPEQYENLVLPKCDKKLDLHKLSSDLGRMVAMHKDKESFVTYPHHEEYSKFYNYEDDLYTYTFVKNQAELKDCGNSLNICVGSYGDRVRRRSSDIIFIREKSNPSAFYACVEVNARSKDITSPPDDPKNIKRVLSQVKLYRNSAGKNVHSLNVSVLKWCREREIVADSCYDINPPMPVQALSMTIDLNEQDDPRYINAGGIANGW